MASCSYGDDYLRKRFAGKVAICTASTAGIGFAAAERIAREGAKVVICSRRQEKVDAAVKKLREQNLEVSGIVCHQAKKEDRQRLIDFTLATYGGIDLLFASAGVNPYTGTILSVTEKQWDKLFDVNVKSTFMIIRECVPYMIERGGGAIVTNSTWAALFPELTRDVPATHAWIALKLGSKSYPEPIWVGEFGNFNGPYAVSKSAVHGLTKVLAAPLAHHNIRINCVAPGAFETDFLLGLSQQIFPDETKLPKVFHDLNILSRCGDPAECGAVVAFLLSNDASFMTGEILLACGGFDFLSKSKM